MDPITVKFKSVTVHRKNLMEAFDLAPTTPPEIKEFWSAGYSHLAGGRVSSVDLFSRKGEYVGEVFFDQQELKGWIEEKNDLALETCLFVVGYKLDPTRSIIDKAKDPQELVEILKDGGQDIEVYSAALEKLDILEDEAVKEPSGFIKPRMIRVRRGQ